MSKKGGKLSLLFGMIAGTATGLLFAPSKGKDLRDKIAKEREKGGVGHKAVGKELTKMADEVQKLVKDVAETEEAKQFWQKTTETVSDLTKGSVELDEWVKEAHEKADMLKDTVTKYAKERQTYIDQATGTVKKTVKKAKSAAKKGKAVAKKTVKKAKSTVKKAKSTAKTVKKKVKAKTKAVEKAVKGKTTTKKKKPTAKKSTAKKPAAKKKTTKKK
jgi:gas vesicle protein